jgi:2-dehydropantoate 2-reductase
MRIAILGAGAVGGYYGGRLAQGGEEVIFIARGENLRALRENGLRVDSVKGNFLLYPVIAVENPAEVGPVDAVIVAVKTWQLPVVIESIPPLVGKDTMVVSLLNGVEAPFQIDATLGPGYSLPGLARLFSALTAPGHVVHSGGPASIQFGEMDNFPRERTHRLCNAFLNAGVTANIPADIHAALWEKLLFIVAFASVGAVTRAPIGVLRSLPEVRAMLEQAMREIEDVAAARGVDLGRDVVARNMSFIDSQPYEGMASMQRDILMGRRSELDGLTGAVVRLGVESGVPVPMHTFLYHSLLSQELKSRGELNY